MALIFSCVIDVGLDICGFEGRVESCHKHVRYLANRPTFNRDTL